MRKDACRLSPREFCPVVSLTGLSVLFLSWSLLAGSYFVEFVPLATLLLKYFERPPFSIMKLSLGLKSNSCSGSVRSSTIRTSFFSSCFGTTVLLTLYFLSSRSYLVTLDFLEALTSPSPKSASNFIPVSTIDLVCFAPLYLCIS